MAKYFNVMKKLTKEIWVERFHKLHGTNKFDYSEFVYVNDCTKGKITCLVCKHVFWSKPSVHSRHGCISCRGIASSKYNSLGLNAFIEKANELHGNDRYDYSLITEYKNLMVKVPIVCKKCNETFWKTPNAHLKKLSYCSCPTCAKDEFAENFKDNVRKKWGDRFILDLSDYVDFNTPINVVCAECSHSFTKRPKSFYLYGTCPGCNNGSVSQKETAWLDLMKIPPECRQQLIPNTSFRGDGLIGNTIYEFYGDFWHGNPARYPSNKINKVNKYTMEYLFQKTLKREAKLKSLGYHLIYIWESDYDAGLDQSTRHPFPSD